MKSLGLAFSPMKKEKGKTMTQNSWKLPNFFSFLKFLPATKQCRKEISRNLNCIEIHSPKYRISQHNRQYPGSMLVEVLNNKKLY